MDSLIAWFFEENNGFTTSLRPRPDRKNNIKIDSWFELFLLLHAIHIISFTPKPSIHPSQTKLYYHVTTINMVVIRSASHWIQAEIEPGTFWFWVACSAIWATELRYIGICNIDKCLLFWPRDLSIERVTTNKSARLCKKYFFLMLKLCYQIKKLKNLSSTTKVFYTTI